MNWTSRLLAALLVIPMLVVSHGALGMGVSAPQSSHPAGCHGTMPAAPSPAHANYECCAGGHDWAIPSPAFSLHSLLAYLISPAQDRRALVLAHYRAEVQLVVPSDSPPVPAPLRI